MSTHNHSVPEEIAALAADPDTDWDMLHWIAEHYPQLRPAVAANPGTYQELVEALAAMGDPAVDAAIALREDSRPSGTAAAVQEAPADPLEGMYESRSEHEDTAGAVTQAESVPPREVRSKRGGGGASWVLIGAATLVVLLGMGTLLWTLLSPAGDPVAESEPAPQEAEQSVVPPADPEERDEGQAEAEEEGTDVAQARAEVEGLPVESSCGDSSQDAGVVAAFIQAAEDSDQGESQAGADLLEETFEDLQSNCDAIYAAEVYEVLRSGEESSEEVTASVETVGTGWVDQVVPADGAQEMDGFVTPDENIHCVFEGGVTCTALQQTSAAPAGCGSGATFGMEVSGSAGLDCGNEVSSDQDRSTLPHDSTATDGLLACVSLDDRVSCWNTLTGAGFEISERDHYSYSY